MKTIFFIILSLTIGYISLCFYLNSAAGITRLNTDYACDGTYITPIITTGFYINNIQKIDPNWKNSVGQNLILSTIPLYGEKNCHKEKVKKLILLQLKNGVNINAYRMPLGINSIHSAILANEPELLDFLLKNGANPMLPYKKEGVIGIVNAIEFIDYLDKQKESQKVDRTNLREVVSKYTKVKNIQD